MVAVTSTFVTWRMYGIYPPASPYRITVFINNNHRAVGFAAIITTALLLIPESPGLLWRVERGKSLRSMCFVVCVDRLLLIVTTAAAAAARWCR